MNTNVHAAFTLSSGLRNFDQSGWPDSNRRPRRPERRALPACATPRIALLLIRPQKYGFFTKMPLHF